MYFYCTTLTSTLNSKSLIDTILLQKPSKWLKMTFFAFMHLHAPPFIWILSYYEAASFIYIHKVELHMPTNHLGPCEITPTPNVIKYINQPAAQIGQTLQWHYCSVGMPCSSNYNK